MSEMATGEIMRHEGGMPAIDHGATASDALGQEVGRAAELGTSQLEAQARAMIQARFFMAKQPGMQRIWDQVEQKLRKECARPGFANSAWWVLPLGNDPKKYPAGLSIRFAEAALRMCGNIDVLQSVVFDDAWKRIARITVMDLESNFGYTTEVTIDKTVERTDPKGREVLSYRQNSYGKVVYVVTGTEQEIALKQGSAVSKAIRTNGLRLIPGDILDECRLIILATKAKGLTAEDPEQARKVILDNFATLNVMPADIAKLIEHDTSHFLPADRELLRGVYTAIQNGVATWKEILEAKFGPPAGVEVSEGASKVKDILTRRAESRKQATDQTPEATQGATATATTQTPDPAPQAPTAPQSVPPSNLPNLQDFPEASEPEWVKVKNVVYKLHDTGYRVWGDLAPMGPEAKAGQTKRQQRGPMTFGDDK